MMNFILTNPLTHVKQSKKKANCTNSIMDHTNVNAIRIILEMTTVVQLFRLSLVRQKSGSKKQVVQRIMTAN